MTYDTVITNSHIILPQGILNKNIIIDEEKIVGFTNDTPACDHKINGNNLISIPGPIDTHVHYGVYSPIDEAAKSESHAAAIGGITTMMRMLRLGNSFKSSLPPQLEAASKNHYIDYAIHMSIFSPQQIGEMTYCIENGITSFKICRCLLYATTCFTNSSNSGKCFFILKSSLALKIFFSNFFLFIFLAIFGRSLKFSG